MSQYLSTLHLFEAQGLAVQNLVHLLKSLAKELLRLPVHINYAMQYFNPLYTGGLFYWYMLDESICHFRGDGSILSHLFLVLMENPASKQCKA